MAFVLRRKDDGEVIWRWSDAPSLLLLPDGGKVMGAQDGWEDANFELVEIADPE